MAASVHQIPVGYHPCPRQCSLANRSRAQIRRSRIPPNLPKPITHLPAALVPIGNPSKLINEVPIQGRFPRLQKIPGPQRLPAKHLHSKLIQKPAMQALQHLQTAIIDLLKPEAVAQGPRTAPRHKRLRHQIHLRLQEGLGGYRQEKTREL